MAELGIERRPLVDPWAWQQFRWTHLCNLPVTSEYSIPALAWKPPGCVGDRISIVSCRMMKKRDRNNTGSRAGRNVGSSTSGSAFMGLDEAVGEIFRFAIDCPDGWVEEKDLTKQLGFCPNDKITICGTLITSRRLFNHYPKHTFFFYYYYKFIILYSVCKKIQSREGRGVRRGRAVVQCFTLASRTTKTVGKAKKKKWYRLCKISQTRFTRIGYGYMLKFHQCVDCCIQNVDL